MAFYSNWFSSSTKTQQNLNESSFLKIEDNVSDISTVKSSKSKTDYSTKTIKQLEDEVIKRSQEIDITDSQISKTKEISEELYKKYLSSIDESVNGLQLKKEQRYQKKTVKPSKSLGESYLQGTYIEDLSQKERDVRNYGFTKEKLIEAADFAKLAYKSDEFHKPSHNSKHVEKLKNAGFKALLDLQAEGWTIKSFKRDGQHAGRLFFKDNRVVISYQGTSKSEDWGYNLDAGFTKLDNINGEIHSGFKECYLSTKQEILKKISNYCTENKISKNNLNFSVTGHSLGAAQASVCALDLVKSEKINPDNIEVITYASPRAYSAKAAEEYDSTLGFRTIRIAQSRADIVPAVAPGFMGFKHVGLVLTLDKFVNKKWSPIGYHDMDAYRDIIADLNPSTPLLAEYRPKYAYDKAEKPVAGKHTEMLTQQQKAPQKSGWFSCFGF